MEDFENTTRYAVYSNFAVASEGDKYKLSLGTFSGTAGDSLTPQAGHSFSTKDRDNDVYSKHCAQEFKGAWWYRSCHVSNLNGLYLRGPHASYADGIEWWSWHDQHYSLKKVEMKLRP
ncbi:Ryncolin-4 [Lamellibrachia satsuma]|nr:Ryncolin-4 [Lamellibrachia satsuma]